MICFKSHTMRETEMSHTVRDKKMLLTRLKKIQGQSAALEKMLNSDHECADVLQQLAAIRGAVNGMMMQVSVDLKCLQSAITKRIQEKI